ncbi:hypothetical protein CH373_11275 [Leptospira perolatii]|uniref:Uncharacterized protein n=1 Tax=Leptospira perolatii TaxID=2023191 RepID=A0A2M9ZM34_9LEPT|nr:hypothetical protein [Leptospira perolatii]PJZ69716.1 hypothetical protein CH360_08960 [Leptospira perolatii]PJZ73069.1 hypothetical protein CH373_11275 [Leptospira perolatii]
MLNTIRPDPDEFELLSMLCVESIQSELSENQSKNVQNIFLRRPDLIKKYANYLDFSNLFSEWKEGSLKINSPSRRIFRFNFFQKSLPWTALFASFLITLTIFLYEKEKNISLIESTRGLNRKVENQKNQQSEFAIPVVLELKDGRSFYGKLSKEERSLILSRENSTLKFREGSMHSIQLVHEEHND